MTTHSMAGSITPSTPSTSSSEVAVSPDPEVALGSNSNLPAMKEGVVVGNESTTNSPSQAKHIGTQSCQTGKRSHSK